MTDRLLARILVVFLLSLVLILFLALGTYDAETEIVFLATVAACAAALAGWTFGTWHERRRLSKLSPDDQTKPKRHLEVTAGVVTAVLPIAAVPITSRLHESFAYIVFLIALLTGIACTVVGIIRERARSSVT